MGLDRFAEDIMRTLQQYYDAHENHETHMTTVLECKQRNSFFILNGCILVGVANKKGQGQNCQSDLVRRRRHAAVVDGHTSPRPLSIQTN